MKMISLDALHAIVKSYVDENMIANTTFTATKEDLTGLLNKIAKEVTIDGDYSEGLDFMSGYDITLGNTIEEYFANFIAPEDYDETGAECKAPSRLTWQKPTYSSVLAGRSSKPPAISVPFKRRSKTRATTSSSSRSSPRGSMIPWRSISTTSGVRLSDSPLTRRSAWRMIRYITKAVLTLQVTASRTELSLTPLRHQRLCLGTPLSIKEKLSRSTSPPNSPSPPMSRPGSLHQVRQDLREGIQETASGLLL